MLKELKRKTKEKIKRKINQILKEMRVKKKEMKLFLCWSIVCNQFGGWWWCRHEPVVSVVFYSGSAWSKKKTEQQYDIQTMCVLLYCCHNKTAIDDNNSPQNAVWKRKTHAVTFRYPCGRRRTVRTRAVNNIKHFSLTEPVASTNHVEPYVDLNGLMWAGWQRYQGNKWPYVFLTSNLRHCL